jgi:hypothetical protein
LFLFCEPGSLGACVAFDAEPAPLAFGGIQNIEERLQVGFLRVNQVPAGWPAFLCVVIVAEDDDDSLSKWLAGMRSTKIAVLAGFAKRS